MASSSSPGRPPRSAPLSSRRLWPCGHAPSAWGLPSPPCWAWSVYVYMCVEAYLSLWASLLFFPIYRYYLDIIEHPEIFQSSQDTTSASSKALNTSASLSTAIVLDQLRRSWRSFKSSSTSMSSASSSKSTSDHELP